jgi:Tol biopolymer transport system component
MVRTLLTLWAFSTLTAATPPAAPRDTQPWWSPQGTTIAFQRESPGPDNGDVVFTPAVRGKEFDIIGNGQVRGFRPVFGDLLVEIGSSTSVRDSSDRQVGSIPGTDATWSPDGTQVAFLQGDVLSVSAPSGASVRQLVGGIVLPTDDVTGPVWSPDGMSIAIATGSTIEVVPVDGSKPHVVFDGPSANVNPSWSHDGTTIAFERNVGGRWAIWTVEPDGSGAHETIGGAANNRFPQWSPVDSRLAYISDRGGAYAVYDGDPQPLVTAVAPDSPARWSPDGAELAVSSARDCRRFGIYVVSSTAPKPVRRSNQCRIDGTPGDDFLTGTPYYDLVYGYGGNDSIFAGNGDDVVYGGNGNDQIGGGPGNDLVDGGVGNDILSGGVGNDVIYGGPGRDKIGCGPGNDTAYVGPGDTTRDCEHVHRSK